MTPKEQAERLRKIASWWPNPTSVLVRMDIEACEAGALAIEQAETLRGENERLVHCLRCALEDINDRKAERWHAQAMLETGLEPYGEGR